MRRVREGYDRVVHVRRIGGAEAAELRSVGFSGGKRGDVRPGIVRATTHDKNVRRKRIDGDLMESFVENVQNLGREKDVSVDITIELAGVGELGEFREDGTDIREMKWIRLEVRNTGNAGWG